MSRRWAIISMVIWSFGIFLILIEILSMIFFPGLIINSRMFVNIFKINVILQVLIAIFIFIYSIYFIITSKNIPEERRTFLFVMIILFHFFAFPIIWSKYIWKSQDDKIDNKG